MEKIRYWYIFHIKNTVFLISACVTLHVGILKKSSRIIFQITLNTHDVFGVFLTMTLKVVPKVPKSQKSIAIWLQPLQNEIYLSFVFQHNKNVCFI
jgi:hypothetical protein